MAMVESLHHNKKGVNSLTAREKCPMPALIIIVSQEGARTNAHAFRPCSSVCR